MQKKRLRRMLRLLAMLPLRPTANLTHIACDLRVDVRTVRRDGALLAAAGLATHDNGCLWLDAEQRELVGLLAGECLTPIIEERAA